MNDTEYIYHALAELQEQINNLYEKYNELVWLLNKLQQQLDN